MRLHGSYTGLDPEIAFININSYGCYFAVYTVLILGTLFSKNTFPGNKERYALFLILTVSIILLLFMKSRSGLVAIGASFIPLVYFRIHMKPGKYLLMISGMAILIFILFLYFLLPNILTDPAILTRFDIWKFYTSATMEHQFLFGFGIAGSFKEIYQINSNLLLNSSNMIQFISGFQKLPHPHSVPINIFFSFGIAGLILLAASALSILHQIYHNRNNIDNIYLPELMVLIALFSHSFFDYIIMDTYIFYPAAAILGIFFSNKNGSGIKLKNWNQKVYLTTKILILL
ncbi:MAG: O-antigen ligase family protein, partial [Spirochaetia bacterium]|nr:O-antigen ligase family protein [Spirochaetia bacterium]